MKTIITTIAGLGFLVTTTLSQPVQANQRLCIASEINGSIVCGRRATQREVRSYNRRYGRRDSNYEYSPNRDRRVVRRKINRVYRDVLGRRGDREGLRTYTKRVLSGRWNIREVRKDLARSEEARDKINQIYREVLGRNADSEGLRTYRKRLEKGWSLSRVRRDISNSSEAKERRGRS